MSVGKKKRVASCFPPCCRKTKEKCPYTVSAALLVMKFVLVVSAIMFN